MTLIIDAGNTNIKLGYFDKNKLLDLVIIPKVNLSAQIKLKKCLVSECYIGTVVPSTNAKLTKIIKNNYKLTPIFLKQKDFCKHFNLNRFNLNEIGIDILGFSLFLQKKYKKILGISFGTATFAVLVDNKNIQGVIIAPSIETSIKQLNKTELTKTSGFYQNKNLYNYLDFGTNTTNAIASGTNHLTQGLVRNILWYVNEKYHLNKCCITGGKANYLSFLKNFKKNTVYKDNCVLWGYKFLIDDLAK